MTKQEKEDITAKIIKEYGPPEFDFDQTPLNECAKRVRVVREEYRRERLAEARAIAKQNAADKPPETIKTLAEDSNKKQQAFRKEYVPLPSFCNEEDLVAFTDTEKRIIQHKLNNYRLSDTDISIHAHVSRHAVTALLKTTAWKLLFNKVYMQLLPIDALGNLREHMKEDSKINMRVCEHFGIIKPEKTEIELNKPIEDLQAIKLLRELGDKLANE